MMVMEKAYVEQRNSGYYLVNSRVSLEFVIFAFLDGLSAETIATECFPTLTLEQVYGAITYYLANRSELASYLEQVAVDDLTFQQKTRAVDLAFHNKLLQARQQLLVKP
jgi:uncharacterized protein (DUF433 family)